MNQIAMQLITLLLTNLPTLISAGVDVTQRIMKARDLASAGAAGKLTPEMIRAARAQLDDDMDYFNKDLPPET